ncbi:GNAT family N-acetyltransferase [Kriegella sp. EG-1]|nr:GNAT family N-acetyltransferase [Flavobacteriaceae bacterium EG-1]
MSNNILILESIINSNLVSYMSNSSQKNQFTIRPMVIDDMTSIMQLKNAENWNQTNLDWKFLINKNPKHCFVACDKKEIVGTVTAMVYGSKLTWIGMMLVAKNYRGLGISKLLMNTVINKLQHIKSIKLDATKAGIPVYKKLGFKSEFEILRMAAISGFSNKLNQISIENPALQPITTNNITEIALFDYKMYGVNRQILFNRILKQEGTNNWFLKKDGEVTGFVLSRNGSQYFHVGPLISQSVTDSKLLLSKVFLNITNIPILVDLLEEQTELLTWLISNGFLIQRSFKRMYLKNNVCNASVKNQYLIAGPELG